MESLYDVIFAYDVIPKIEVFVRMRTRKRLRMRIRELINSRINPSSTVPDYSKINGNARIRTLDL